MKVSNKIKTKIFAISVVLLFAVFIAYARYCKYLLVSDHKVAIGHIDNELIRGREQHIVIKFHFTVDGKIYKDEATFSQRFMSFENAKLLDDKDIPLVYNDKLHTMLSYLLIFPDEYDEFRIQYPDSLKWILPLIEK
jgi:hypothetical protein